MSSIREPCGCRHNGTRWTDFCPAHKTEFETMHRQAQEDYRRKGSGVNATKGG